MPTSTTAIIPTQPSTPSPTQPSTTNAQRILRSASYAVKAAGPVAALVTLIKLSKMVARAATSLPSFSVRYGVREGTNTGTCGEDVEEDEEDSNIVTSFWEVEDEEGSSRFVTSSWEVEEEDSSSFAINPWEVEVEVRENEEYGSSLVTNPWEVEVEAEGVLVPEEMSEWAGREAVGAWAEEMEEEECYICGGECFCRYLA